MFKRKETYSFKPRLENLPSTVDSSKKAGNKRKISGRNISTFYSNVYCTLFGGRIIARKSRYDVIKEDKKVKISPDINKLKDNGEIETEIKAVSTRWNQHTCGVDQLRNYCFNLLKEINSGKEYEFEYAFFRYGHWTATKLYRLNKSQLVKKLSEETRFLNIFPLNLTLLVLFDSKEHEANHKTSKGPDKELYKYPKGKLMTDLNTDPKNLEKVIENQRLSGISLGFSKESFIDEIIGDLFLDKINFHGEYSPPIKVEYYGKEHLIKPFPVARYYLTEDDSQRWKEHFLTNHKRILDNLNIEDLFEEHILTLEDLKPSERDDEIPF